MHGLIRNKLTNNIPGARTELMNRDLNGSLNIRQKGIYLFHGIQIPQYLSRKNKPINKPIDKPIDKLINKQVDAIIIEVQSDQRKHKAIIKRNNKIQIRRKVIKNVQVSNT